VAKGDGVQRPKPRIGHVTVLRQKKQPQKKVDDKKKVERAGKKAATGGVLFHPSYGRRVRFLQGNGLQYGREGGTRGEMNLFY